MARAAGRRAQHGPLVMVRNLIQNADGPVLVVHDAAVSGPVAGLTASVVTCTQIGVLPAPNEWSALVLAVGDRAALRRAMSVLPEVGRVEAVCCWLAEAREPVLFLPRPEWAPLQNIAARRTPERSATTVARFLRPVSGRAVLEEMGRYAARQADPGNRGLFVAVADELSLDRIPGDTSVSVLGSTTDAMDIEVVPPDVVLARPGDSTELPAHPVLGRAPAVVSDHRAIVGPVDEAVINPAGFRSTFDPGVMVLEATADPSRLVVRSPAGQLLSIDTHRGLTERNVSELRGVEAVRLAWPGDGVEGFALTVAGLAMAGVPIFGHGVPVKTRSLLGASLADLLDLDPEIATPLQREEHSVRLRRAGFLDHSSAAWRARVGRAAGVHVVGQPRTSIVMATRRPARLEFALRQVAKQQDVQVELILATHGFEADHAQVRENLGDLPTTLMAFPLEARFGDVLQAASDAASGDLVLKMDDDDWYGPAFVADLLLARTHSGADVVGTTAEFTYLEPVDQTIRRNDRSEVPAKFVAGGTMMLDTNLLRSVGGFRSVTKFVDAQLLTAVRAAGGLVYRGHGLGYVLRRTGSGHTWEPGLEYFLDPARLDEQWAGFAPSRLLEYQDAEVPGPRGRDA